MNWAVVMAGGRGTRFWPESRTKHPKPFLRLVGRQTLLQETVAQLHPFFPPSRILLVLQKKLVREAQRLLPKIPKENILGEPVGRNTAPCAVYAAGVIASRDRDANFVFLPADHSIRPKSLFLKSLKTAFEVVDERPVLFGIRPRWPNPAYGYLEVGPRSAKKHGFSLFPVHRFHEKPPAAVARQFLKRGNFFWNGGIFVWRLRAFQRAVQKYLPKLSAGFGKGKRITALYAKFPSVSLDYGIMEKLEEVHCLEAPFEWNDLGGWPGAAEFWPKDSRGNRIQGPVLLVHSRRNIVKSNKRLVALLGVEDLMVVDTEDALLVAPRARAEQIREIVSALEKQKKFSYL